MSQNERKDLEELCKPFTHLFIEMAYLFITHEVKLPSTQHIKNTSSISS
jgi:hypothetical protein